MQTYSSNQRVLAWITHRYEKSRAEQQCRPNDAVTQCMCEAEQSLLHSFAVELWADLVTGVELPHDEPVATLDVDRRQP